MRSGGSKENQNLKHLEQMKGLDIQCGNGFTYRNGCHFDKLHFRNAEEKIIK